MAKPALTAYRAKRDFSKTDEPSGEARVAPSPRLRFVVQKHAARQLHYDLRLEWDGVFKSWAVARGPSLDPADKRLAVEVEDHPLDYGDFEGTIPKGEYGGGTVQLWDRGYWTPEGAKTPQEALHGGDLKFTLEGRRAARQLGAGAHARRPLRRQANQLAADQAPGSDGEARRCRCVARGGSFRGIGPHDAADRRRAWADAPSRSCWRRPRPARPMPCGTATAPRSTA